jgi:hypothetical protein
MLSSAQEPHKLFSFEQVILQFGRNSELPNELPYYGDLVPDENRSDVLTSPELRLRQY